MGLHFTKSDRRTGQKLALEASKVIKAKQHHCQQPVVQKRPVVPASNRNCSLIDVTNDQKKKIQVLALAIGKSSTSTTFGHGR